MYNTQFRGVHADNYSQTYIHVNIDVMQQYIMRMYLLVRGNFTSVYIQKP